MSFTSDLDLKNDRPFYDFDFLTNDGATLLKSKWAPKTTYDLVAEKMGDGHGKLDRWTINDLLAGVRGSEKGLCSYGEVLSTCMGLINQSATARPMIQEAMSQKWKIALFDLKGGDYWIDVEEKLVLLDSNTLTPSALDRSVYFKNMIIVTLIKALRDIWQEKRHGGFDENYKAEHVMTLERVRAADCDVLSLIVAWELRSGSYGDLWRHLIGSENGDMAMAFSSYLERNPAGQFNGQAAAAAFRQWFRCETRVNTCDHNTLEYLDDVMKETQDQNPFGMKKATPTGIEILSCLPDRTAYLQGQGSEILADPLYCGMEDPINQSHLFHILYDLEATIVENVPFRDARLARRIFPSLESSATARESSKAE